MTLNRSLRLGFVLTGLLSISSPVRGENPAAPTFSSFAGAFVGASDHNYFVESSLQLPLFQFNRFGADFHYHEATPFLVDTNGPQAEVLSRLQELTLDYRINDQLRLLAVGGYQSVYAEDAPGFMSAYKLGGGIGSPARRNGEPLNWSVTAGIFLSRNQVQEDWWMDGNFSWRAIEFARSRYLDSEFNAALVLNADIEALMDANRIHALYKVGPALQLMTAAGNRALFHLAWYHNDGNQFYGSNENAMLLGLEVNSSFATNTVLDARQSRKRGWFPLVWGGYDTGIGSTRRVSDFEMNAEIVDFLVREQLITFRVCYQSRQEYRTGDYDNIAYTVVMSLQSVIGLESSLSHGDPLVAGLDFYHRSDHALSPDAARIPAGATIDNGRHNLFPRLRLQTIGWDLPYRDPAMYRQQTSWVNYIDWMTAVGYVMSDDRDRDKFSAQLGANWDVATLEGHVVYLRGIGTVGTDSPDWLGELGIRRPVGKLFVRWDSYGMRSPIARGNTLIVGAGVNL